MTILSIASRKGGAGKTTLCRVLAPVLARRDLTVACLDADTNQGLLRWHSQFYEGPPFRVEAEPDEVRLAHRALALSKEVDVVLIDTPGFESRAMLIAMGVSDAVLIPCMPDSQTIAETRRTADWVESTAVQTRRAIPCRVVLTAFDGRRAADRFTVSELTGTHGLTVIASVLSQRQVYRDITFSGAAPRSGPVWREAEALADELARLGWVPESARAA
jgi:chromosome partitioning protein